MNIAQIIFTRNEGELLRQNIEFHRKLGVDFFVITESSSTDNTVDIIKSYEEKGFAKCFYDERVMAQKESMDHMAKWCRDHLQVDWIIVSDTDEFWCPQGETLKVYLSKISEDINTLKIRRYQYFPTAVDTDKGNLIYKRMSFREDGVWLGFDTGVGIGKNSFARKKIMFKPITNDIDISAGNHTVHFTGRNVMEIEDSSFIVREYPFRSYDEFLKKVMRVKDVINKNLTYQQNKKFGTHWRQWYEIYEKGGLEEWYNDNIYFSKNRLNHALKQGTLVEDKLLTKVL